MSLLHELRNFPEDLCGMPVHLIGAKGTGMCALAELLVRFGAQVSGSDTQEKFYTDAILSEIGVRVSSFSQDSLPKDTALVIHSAAYNKDNSFFAEALQRKIPLYSYPEALGFLSTQYDATAIAGVHGKTSTTAIVGTLLRGLALPATVLLGTSVVGFGNRCTWHGGDQFFVAETCEYRRHFLHYRPQRIVLTSIESDHQDYYPNEESISQAFKEFVLSLPQGGELIFCQDDERVRKLVRSITTQRSDLIFTPYGLQASGPWRVRYTKQTAGKNRFRVDAFEREFSLSVPGRHLALDAVAALALLSSLYRSKGTSESKKMDVSPPPDFPSDLAVEALRCFCGTRRRNEFVGEAGKVLVMDDYAHHPTSIIATLKGLKEFFPKRRLVVDFMPHTYSRTLALFDDFVHAFSDADFLILHPVYASAREENKGSVDGFDLYKKIRTFRNEKKTRYYATLEEAADALPNILRSGDLYITLGAGNNWPLGRRALEVLTWGEAPKS